MWFGYLCSTGLVLFVMRLELLTLLLSCGFDVDFLMGVDVDVFGLFARGVMLVWRLGALYWFDCVFGFRVR